MAVIEWCDELNVGVSEIDQHHRHLVALLNRLHDVMRERRAPVVVGEVLSELVNYTHYHFAEEERLMAEADCPVLASHCVLHRQLTDHVGAMMAEFQAEPDGLTAAELFEFLSDWLFHHIRTEDMAYRPWLAKA